MNAQITDTAAAAKFAFAAAGKGSTIFTVVSPKTGARFTYRMRAAEDGSMLFASVLTGANNESDYSYAGVVAGEPGKRVFRSTKASKVGADAPSVKALEWCIRRLAGAEAGEVADLGFELWHEGRCGRCGRKLTVPGSIEIGLGPECAGK